MAVRAPYTVPFDSTGVPPPVTHATVVTSPDTWQDTTQDAQAAAEQIVNGFGSQIMQFIGQQRRAVENGIVDVHRKVQSFGPGLDVLYKNHFGAEAIHLVVRPTNVLQTGGPLPQDKSPPLPTPGLLTLLNPGCVVYDNENNVYYAYSPDKWTMTDTVPGYFNIAPTAQGRYRKTPTVFYTDNGNYSPGIPVAMGQGATGNSSVVQIGDYTGDGFNAIAIFNGGWSWSAGSGIQNYAEPTDLNPTNLNQSALSHGVMAFVPGWGVDGLFVLACNTIGFGGNWWSGPAIQNLPYTSVLSGAQIAVLETAVLSPTWPATVAAYAPGMILPGAYSGTTLDYLNNVVFPFVWPYISPAPNSLEPTPPNQIVTAAQGGGIQYFKQLVIYTSTDGSSFDQVYAGSEGPGPTGGSAPTPNTNSYSILSGSFFSNLLGTTSYNAFTFYTVSYSGGSNQTATDSPTPTGAQGYGDSNNLGSDPNTLSAGDVTLQDPLKPTDAPFGDNQTIHDPATGISLATKILVDPFFGSSVDLVISKPD